MPSGLRARSILYAFPFYERDDTYDAYDIREDATVRVLTRLEFVRKVWVDKDKLRDPLMIEVNPQHRKLQDKSIAEIEAGLETLLGKIYNFRECR